MLNAQVVPSPRPWRPWEWLRPCAGLLPDAMLGLLPCTVGVHGKQVLIHPISPCVLHVVVQSVLLSELRFGVLVIAMNSAKLQVFVVMQEVGKSRGKQGRWSIPRKGQEWILVYFPVQEQNWKWLDPLVPQALHRCAVTPFCVHAPSQRVRTSQSNRIQYWRLFLLPALLLLAL